MPETKYNPETNQFEPVEDTSIVKLAGPAPWAAPKPEQSSGSTVQNITGSVGTALSNVPSSAWNVAKDMAQVFIHPITTAQNIGGLAAGIVEKAIPGEQGHEAYANALGQYFIDRYGSLENIKKTFEEDPVGFAADVSTIFTGGGGIAGRLPGVAGKVGKTVATLGEYIDPLKAVGTVAEKTAEAAGKGIRKVQGVATRTGERSMEEALKAGLEGGEYLEKYKQAQKGITSPEDIVQNFKDALVTVRTKRGDKYQTEMMPLNADTTVLDWTNIDQAIAKAEEAKTFKGQKLSSNKQQYIKDEMLDALNEWKNLDPTIYHTPAGMNALRQKLWNYVDDFELNSPERKAAGEIYHTIKKEITRQVPQYSKIMKGYEDASNLISEIERSLSLKKYGTTEAALRKLQTVLKSDVNPAYENRAKLVEYLVENGSPTLMSELAGLSHAPKFSPGIQGKMTTAAATAPALLFSIASNPLGMLAAVPGLALTSPRTMGNLNVLVGTGMRYGKNISEAIPEPLKQALKKSPYAGYYSSQLEKEKPIQTEALPPWKQPLALSSNPNRVYNPETNEFEPVKKSPGGSVTDRMHMANGGTPFAGSSNSNKVYNPRTKQFELVKYDPKHWTRYDKTWNSLNGYQKAAVMSLMEAEAANPEDAKNILGAMVNRAARSKEDLGAHVSKKIYQPTFEPTQRARLNKLLKNPALPELIDWVQKRSQGLEPDNVGGATHYLAHEPVMLALQRKQPRKYRSWVNWTQFNPETKTYGNVTMRDKSHAFLAPEGKYSAPYTAPQQVAGEIPPILRTVTPEERDRAKLTQMAEAAAEPVRPAPADQAAMTNLVKETATPVDKPKLTPEEEIKFLEAIQGFMKGQRELPASVAPMPQAPKPEIPIVMPYAKAQAHGGSVTHKMHQARKKKEVGGSATDDMTWGDVAEQYKKNIGPDIKQKASDVVERQKAGLLNPIGSISQAAQTVLDLGKGAYDFGTKAYDVGVGLGSKALGSLGYNPTGDVKYHREQALDELLGKATEENLKKYIVENPAEATATVGSFGLGTAALGRKVLTSPLTREFIANQEGSLNLGKLPGMGHNMPPETIETPKRQLKEGLYSALDESFNQTDRKRGIPAAWRNEFRRQGVSDSEMKWRGLNDFFASKPGNQDITRDEIQEFLKTKQLAPTSFVKQQGGDPLTTETTSQYIRNKPIGGKDYTERVTKLDENVLPENQEWVHAGGPHPDSNVKKPLGWTLEETYDDLLNRGKGQVIHEIQSPYGQKLATERNIDPQQKASLKEELNQLDAFIEKNKYLMDQHYHQIPYDLQDIPDDLRNDVILAFKEKNKLQKDIMDTQRAVDRFGREANDPNLFTYRELKDEPGVFAIYDPNLFQYYNKRFFDEASVKAAAEEKTNKKRELAQGLFKNQQEHLNRITEKYNVLLPKIQKLETKLKPIDPNELERRMQDLSDLGLQRAEIQTELEAQPMSPAPFVDVNSGFRTLFQKSLVDAARSGKEWLAISGPQRIKERWGKDTTAKMYENKTTDILHKLAKEHDPKAQIEEFYPHMSFSNEWQKRQPSEYEISRKEWKTQNGEPYYGIRITPEMRKSILEKGFKMMAKGGSVTDKMKLAQSCWKGYKAIGVKTKKGKTVPNCVPIKKKNG